MSAVVATAVDGSQSMKGIKEIKLSRERKANDEGIERLLCDSGVSAGKRPKHGKGSDGHTGLNTTS